ncbi:MAG: hypothetical protein WD628_00750, partial [Thermomicrobiales bacterium]
MTQTKEGRSVNTVNVDLHHSRGQLFEAVTAAFRAIAARTTLLLVIDDLQWADSASCDLLVHVARRSTRSRIAIVAACREGEADANTALTRAIAELNRHRLLTTINLRRLDQRDTAMLCASLLRGQVEPGLAALIHQHSDGNPFFAEELLRALIDDGRLSKLESGWTLLESPGSLLPDGLVAAIRLRLDHLDPEAIDLLETAAVIGRTWRTEALAAVVGQNPEQVEAAVMPAVRMRMIRPEPDGTWSFTHDKIRETLDAGVTPARHRRLHRAIGQAILEDDGDSMGRRLSGLAYHFVRGGDRDRGAEYSLLAGQHALQTHAWFEATRHFDAAVELLPNDDLAGATTALKGLGHSATLAGEYSLAAGAYARLAQAAARRGDRPAGGRAWTALGDVHWREEAIDKARDAFERALDVLGPADSGDRARALLRHAELLSVSLADHLTGRASAEEALRIVRRQDDESLEALAASVLGNVMARQGEVHAGRELLEQALRLAIERDESTQASRTCSYLIPVCHWLGEIRRALELTRIQEQIASRIGDRYQLPYVYVWRGILHSASGDWQDSETAFERGGALLDELEDPAAQLMLTVFRNQNDYLRGQVDTALAGLRDVAGPRGERIPRPNRPYLLGMLARMLIDTGNQADALDCLASLEAIAADATAGGPDRST